MSKEIGLEYSKSDFSERLRNVWRAINIRMDDFLPRNSENKPFLKWPIHDHAWRHGKIVVFFPLEDFASIAAVLAQVWVLFV